MHLLNRFLLINPFCLLDFLQDFQSNPKFRTKKKNNF